MAPASGGGWECSFRREHPGPLSALRMPISKGPTVARRKTRAAGPSDEALRIVRTIVYCEACLDAEVPHAVARELWAHDMKLPFEAGKHTRWRRPGCWRNARTARQPECENPP